MRLQSCSFPKGYLFFPIGIVDYDCKKKYFDYRFNQR